LEDVDGDEGLADTALHNVAAGASRRTAGTATAKAETVESQEAGRFMAVLGLLLVDWDGRGALEKRD
jgi:hypothetical protein